MPTEPIPVNEFITDLENQWTHANVPSAGKKPGFIEVTGAGEPMRYNLNVNDQINLNEVFAKAYNNGIGSILIEGGMKLTKSILKEKLINEFYLFKSKKKLGNLGKNNISDLKKIINFFKKKENIETFLDGDKITRYY